jgi:AcrR family transcriptional regulator
VPRSDQTRQRFIDAADELFYQRGIGATSIDAIVEFAGLTKPTLYRYFPSKERLVGAYLTARDVRNRQALESILDRYVGKPIDRLLAVFDWLDQWYHEPDFRGCAFARASAESLPDNAAVAGVIQVRKRWLRTKLQELAVEAGIPVPVQFSDAMMLLVEGATTTAFVEGDLQAARKAKRVARALVTLFDGSSE